MCNLGAKRPFVLLSLFEAPHDGYALTVTQSKLFLSRSTHDPWISIVRCNEPRESNTHFFNHLPVLIRMPINASQKSTVGKLKTPEIRSHDDDPLEEVMTLFADLLRSRADFLDCGTVTRICSDGRARCEAPIRASSRSASSWSSARPIRIP